MVTHFDGWLPFVVIAVINESSSSFLSFNFLTSDSMARLAKVSPSPPCLWHIRLCTMLASLAAVVGLGTDEDMAGNNRSGYPVCKWADLSAQTKHRKPTDKT
jgi:hypothetical protein